MISLYFALIAGRASVIRPGASILRKRPQSLNMGDKFEHPLTRRQSLVESKVICLAPEEDIFSMLHNVTVQPNIKKKVSIVQNKAPCFKLVHLIICI